MAIESRDELFEDIRQLAETWKLRSAGRALSLLSDGWPVKPGPQTEQYRELLGALENVRDQAADELLGDELARVTDAINVLETVVYRC